VPTTTIKFIELVARIKIQLIKSGKLHVRYPYIIYSNVEHRYGRVPLGRLRYKTCSKLNLLVLMSR